MPNALTTFLKNALTVTSAINGGTEFVREGVTITGVFNDYTVDSEAVFGGSSDEKTCALLVETDNLEGVDISKGQIWLYDSIRWRIYKFDRGESATMIYFKGAEK